MIYFCGGPFTRWAISPYDEPETNTGIIALLDLPFRSSGVMRVNRRPPGTKELVLVGIMRTEVNVEDIKSTGGRVWGTFGKRERVSMPGYMYLSGFV